MKILMITPEPFFQPRGTPFSVLYRTKAITSFGHKVDMVTYHIGEDADLANTKIFRIPRISFVKHIPIGPSFTKIFLDLFLFILAFLRLLVNRYDCIYVHEEAGVMGVLLKKVFRLPLVYDMHSSIPQQMINFNFATNRLVLKLMSFIEKLIVNNSEIIVVICPSLKDIVTSINRCKKVLVIENIPLEDALSPQSLVEVEGARRKLCLAEHKIVLYTGTFEPYQGLELLLEAIPVVRQKIPDVKYVLVGGNETQITNLKQLCREYDILDDVVFTGMVKPKEASKFLALADILVSPRVKGTNVPLKIYTYLASKKPILATAILAHTQVLDDSIAVLKRPDAKSIANGIIDLLTDEERREKLAIAGKRLAESKYSHSNFLSKMREALQTVEELRR